MRDQKQRVMDREVDCRVGQENAAHAADHEGRGKGDREQHRRGEADATARHRQDPVVDLDPGRNPDRHRRHAEDGVEVGALPHREEVVEPHRKRQHRDGHRGIDERGVAVERLAGVRRKDFGVDPESRQDENVDLRVAEQPEQVGIVHQVAARAVREEVETGIAVEGKHDGGNGQRCHREDHQDRGAKRRPAEQRHAEQCHARRPLLVDRDREVQARERGAERTQRHRPDPVIDTNAGTVGNLRE